MIIKYVCSNGKEYNLLGHKMRATAGVFHKYKWEQNATEMELGDNVYGFAKESITYSITFTIRGKLEERRRFLNELHDAFEHDIANATPGRIWYGEYYIECYVTAAENGVSGTWNNWSECAADIYCPYPFWSKEDKKSFYPDSAGKSEAYSFLDYPHDYMYDYSRPSSGSQNWVIDHFRNSNFVMTVYGKCANPRITINGHIYQINDTLEATEYITIDSREKTVTKYLANGTEQNIFGKRWKEQSIFELIPFGNLLIMWNGEFGFDITVYKERSVPEYGTDTD